jgi:DNA-binding transcriptional MerR regulator
MKMRELVARTGVHRETIRVYLRHRLIPEPLRPKPNVADYGEEHVRAVQAIRELQRDRLMTLLQIGEFLKGGGNSKRIEASAFMHLEELVASRVGLTDSRVFTTSLVDRNPHAVADARALAGIGLVSLTQSPAGDELSLTDARLVSIWGEMRAAGFVESVDFAPDVLHFYIGAAEYIAGQEATIFLKRTQGRVDEETAASMLQIALSAMLEFFGLVRLKAFMKNIRPDAEGNLLSSTTELPQMNDRSNAKN